MSELECHIKREKVTDPQCSTGRLLHALGNVRKSQGLLDESAALHRRALQQYLSTIGKNHHRTGDVHVKVAEHCIREGMMTEAK